jgi:hypothetical protein
MAGTILRTVARPYQRGYLHQFDGNRHSYGAVVAVHHTRNIIAGSGSEENRGDCGHDQQQKDDFEQAPHGLHDIA